MPRDPSGAIADAARAPRGRPKPRRAVAAEVASARRRISAARREAARGSLRLFCETYLPDRFTVAPSRMHLEVMELLEEATDERDVQLAIAAPRGHAKSTIVSLAYVLWSICYERERFVVLISNTADQAREFVGDIKREFESNQRLREDFPEVCGDPPAPQPRRWTLKELVTANGVRVMPLGFEQRLRGRRNNADRPSLIVLDDVENESRAESPEQREKQRDWLNRTVLNAGGPGSNTIVVGTLLHVDSLLAGLVKETGASGWSSRVYQAVESWATNVALWDEWEAITQRTAEFEEQTGPKSAARYFARHEEEMLEGASLLWPERETYEGLMRQRVKMGRFAFDAEKQNCPVNPRDCLFAGLDPLYWDDRLGGDFRSPQDVFDSINRYDRTIVAACDPATGKHDFTAIVVLVHDFSTSFMYVLEADLGRYGLSETIDRLISVQQRWGCHDVVIETVGYQRVVQDELERRARACRVYVNVRPAMHSGDKITRIRTLEPLIRSNRLRFSRRHAALIEQLQHFPHGAYDDGPDALQMAISCALHPAARMVEVMGGARC